MPEELHDNQQTTSIAPRRRDHTLAGTLLLLLLGLVAWLLIYNNLSRFADWYTYDFMKYHRAVGKAQNIKVIEGCSCLSATIPENQITADERQGLAVAFILFQLPHTFLLLFLVVFLMGIVRSFFSAERTRALLAGRNPLLARVMAGGLGVVTPFCSCSAVPLFIGFVTAGVPLGATFTFLIAAPMVDVVALSVLFSTFAPTTAPTATPPHIGLLPHNNLIGSLSLTQIGYFIVQHAQQLIVVLLYLITGLTIAFIAGWLVERMKMQRYVEEWVYAMPSASADVQERLTFRDRVRFGFGQVKEIIGRVWIYVLFGIGVGAVLHAFISQALLLSVLGGHHWWSVPLAVLVGVPIYSNPAGIIPVVSALHGQGVPIGTLLALMMSVIGLSLPEFIILRKVLKPQLILFFAGVVALGILIVGYLFNLFLH